MPGKFIAGADVRLVGLESCADLNGQQGQLLSFHVERGRWQVRLDSGEVKNVRAENLVNISQVVLQEDGKPSKGTKGASAQCLKPQATPLRSAARTRATGKAGCCQGCSGTFVLKIGSPPKNHKTRTQLFVHVQAAVAPKALVQRRGPESVPFWFACEG